MSGDVSWSLKTLDPITDRDRAYGLLQACEDFALLTEGEPATLETVDNFFKATPPDRNTSQSLKLGVIDQDDHLIGMLDVARNFPSPRTWYLGLLLLLPSHRSRGVGRQVLEALIHRARGDGAEHLRLAVLDENVRGLAFWRRSGFSEINRFAPRPFGHKMHGRVEMELTLKEF